MKKTTLTSYSLNDEEFENFKKGIKSNYEIISLDDSDSVGKIMKKDRPGIYLDPKFWEGLTYQNDPFKIKIIPFENSNLAKILEEGKF